jgi:hypothetical protein
MHDFVSVSVDHAAKLQESAIDQEAKNHTRSRSAIKHSSHVCLAEVGSFIRSTSKDVTETTASNS